MTRQLGIKDTRLLSTDLNGLIFLSIMLNSAYEYICNQQTSDIRL